MELPLSCAEGEAGTDEAIAVATTVARIAGHAEGVRPRRGGHAERVRATPRGSCVNSRQRVDTGEISQGRPNGGFVVWGGDQNPSGAAQVFMIVARH